MRSSKPRKPLLAPEDAPNDGARRLREMLVRKTQSELAVICDASGEFVTSVAPGAIGAWARGDRRPIRELRVAMERAWGIRAAAWFEANSLAPSSSPATTRDPETPESGARDAK